MGTLTERDKKLLYWMGLVLLAAFFLMVLIEPAMEKASDRSSEFLAAETAVEQAQESIASLPVLSQQRDALTNQKNELAATLNPILPARQIDTAITSLVMSHGLVPYDLSISEPKQAALSPYGGGDASVGAETVQMVNVSFSGTGTTGQVMELLRDISENHPAIRVVSFNPSGGSLVLYQGGLSPDTEINYSFNVEFYMCE